MDPSTTPQILNDPIDTAIRALQGNQAERVDLTGGRAFSMEDEDMTELMGDCWKNNTACTALDFSINHITDAGAKTLAEAIKTHGGALSSLEIDRNKIGDEGAIAIIRALPATLKRFDISGNDITDETLKAFTEWMDDGECKCKHLHTLIIRDCPKLTDAGMESLCWWLAESQPSLQSLTVSGNEFTDAVIPPLKIAIQSNNTLLDVNVSNTKINDFTPLIEAFEKNESLISFTMGSDGRRVNIPKIDIALKANKRKMIARRNEISLLKDEHAREVKALKANHFNEVALLKEQLEELRGQVAQLTASNASLMASQQIDE